MKKFWNAHQLLKLAFPLMLGIGLSSVFHLDNVGLIWIGFAMAVLLSILAAFVSFRSSERWLVGLLVGIAFFSFGFANYQLQHKNTPQFIDNYKAEKQPFALQVIEDPIEKERSFAVLTEIKEHPNQKLAGQKAMIYLGKGRNTKMKKGDVLLVNYFLNEIKSLKNPHEFNYRSFMQKKGVLFQAYLNDKQTVEVISAKATSPSLIQRIRNTGFSFVERYVSEKNQAVAKALLFGFREELSRETSQEFAKAGTMHILAVSGLHVGIIFLLANSFLQFVNRKAMLPKWITVASLIGIIWLFVFLTGAKASVMRAGIMFSLFVFGMHYFPKNYSLNTLGAAAILLLTFTPSNLFDVGFQLSFSAVAGILLIVPMLKNLGPTPKYFIPKYLLDITYVTLAAQLATLPFSLYYFQQFPLLGVFSNLAAIPLAFFIVAIGFIGFLLSAISPIAILLGKVLDVLLSVLQNMNEFFSNLSFSVVDNLYLTTLQAFFLFVSVFALSMMLKTKNTRFLQVSLGALILLFASISLDKWEVENKQEFTVYSINNNVVAQYQNGREVTIFAKDQITDESFQFNILPNLKANYIQKKNFYSLQDSMVNNELFFKNGLLLLPNKSIQFTGDTENISPKVETILLDRPVYKQLYRARDLANRQQVILANTYPNRSVPDTTKGMHFLNSEGFYSED